MINVLITAGGTCESIDSVRSITNHATGALGSIIADRFAEANSKITYVCSETAILPTYLNAEIIPIKNVSELIENLKTLLNQRSFDCIIHSMAVSDYTPQGILSIDQMIENITNIFQMRDFDEDNLANKIEAAIFQSKKQLSKQKIDSKAGDIALLLKQTPKVIKIFKEIQPNALLVGFKLLSNVTEKTLLEAGQNLLIQNKCDFVLANDLINIKRDVHKAILMDKNFILQRAETKKEIAEIIFKNVMERIGA